MSIKKGSEVLRPPSAAVHLGTFGAASAALVKERAAHWQSNPPAELLGAELDALTESIAVPGDLIASDDTYIADPRAMFERLRLDYGQTRWAAPEDFNRRTLRLRKRLLKAPKGPPKKRGRKKKVVDEPINVDITFLRHSKKRAIQQQQQRQQNEAAPASEQSMTPANEADIDTAAASHPMQQQQPLLGRARTILGKTPAQAAAILGESSQPVAVDDSERQDQMQQQLAQRLQQEQEVAKQIDEVESALQPRPGVPVAKRRYVTAATELVSLPTWRKPKDVKRRKGRPRIFLENATSSAEAVTTATETASVDIDQSQSQQPDESPETQKTGDDNAGDRENDPEYRAALETLFQFESGFRERAERLINAPLESLKYNATVVIPHHVRPELNYMKMTSTTMSTAATAATTATTTVTNGGTAANLDEILVTVTLYRAGNPESKFQEVAILGSQTLADLCDAFKCNAAGGDNTECAPPMMYINGHFYDDTRNVEPDTLRQSRLILDWIATRPPDAVKRFSLPTPHDPSFIPIPSASAPASTTATSAVATATTSAAVATAHLNSLDDIIDDQGDGQGMSMFQRRMESSCIGSLTLRLGMPYLFLHNGNCEHVIRFTSACSYPLSSSSTSTSASASAVTASATSTNSDANTNAGRGRRRAARSTALVTTTIPAASARADGSAIERGFPHSIFEGLVKIPRCRMCTYYNSCVAVEHDPRTGADLTLFCDPCFKLFYTNANGEIEEPDHVTRF